MNSTCEPTGQQHLGCVRDAPPSPYYTHSAARLTFREQANAWLRAVCYTLVYPSIEPLHVTDNTNRGPSQHSWPVGSCISGGVFLWLHRDESSGQQACVSMLTGQQIHH